MAYKNPKELTLEHRNNESGRTYFFPGLTNFFTYNTKANCVLNKKKSHTAAGPKGTFLYVSWDQDFIVKPTQGLRSTETCTALEGRKSKLRLRSFKICFGSLKNTHAWLLPETAAQGNSSLHAINITSGPFLGPSSPRSTLTQKGTPDTTLTYQSGHRGQQRKVKGRTCQWGPGSPVSLQGSLGWPRGAQASVAVSLP